MFQERADQGMRSIVRKEGRQRELKSPSGARQEKGVELGLDGLGDLENSPCRLTGYAGELQCMPGHPLTRQQFWAAGRSQ